MKHIAPEMWTKSFDKIAEPGDTVDESIVDQMLNGVSPASIGDGFFQMGEAFAHIPDDRGHLHPIFLTFKKCNGLWTYCGTCFRGQSKHQPGNGDPWAKSFKGGAKK